jgi:methionyl aminopeptidase
LEPLEALREAGRIASQVRGRVCGEIDVGVKVVDICDETERLLMEMGGRPAFPCNVDINHVAAHYASPLGDESVIPEGALVKIDLGVHIDGYVADTAKTVCLDPRLSHMVEAAEAALDAAINNVREGVRASDVGAAIEHAIRSRGLKPIRNLTGHKMTRYVLHAGRSIPNVATHGGQRLEAGEVYAIEPFTVPPEAAGEVTDGPPSNIYLFEKKHSVRGLAKDMLRHIQKEYRTLPFASRWILRRFPGPEGMAAFEGLLRSRCISGYPQLIERTRGMVAQAEHTVIVTGDGCEVTTA